MDLSAYKTIAIGGIPMKKLTLDGVQIWKRPPINWVRRSINTDGTIYNNGLGYKDGYRVRSGGAEAAIATASCTGYIPVQSGDIIRISGCDFDTESTGNAINASNSSFTNLGQLTPSYATGGYGIFINDYRAYSWNSVVKEKDGVWKWIVPPSASGVAYIRVNGYTPNGNHGANMIVTINEPIE